MFIPAILFALGLALIIKGGDFFVDAAVWVARVSGLPSVIIGATVVSMATTLPELTVSVLASAVGKNAIAVGNAVGSVTANLGLILALCIIARPFALRRRAFTVKGGIMLAAMLALLVFAHMGPIGYGQSAVLLALFGLFIYENIKGAEDAGGFARAVRPEPRQVGENLIRFGLGLGGILAGANLLVKNGSLIALALGVPESVIAVTLVAVGTSLPELVTAVTCIRKGQGAMAAGNIIGANIMDTTLILPLCAAVSGQALHFPLQSRFLDLPFCLAIGLVAILPAVKNRRFKRWQGIVMLGLYAIYIAAVV